MRVIYYSHEYRIKTLKLKDYLVENFGESVCLNTLKRITDAIHNLILFPKSGQCVEDVFGIESDYWFIYVQQNYIFYKITRTAIEVVNIYNEKEDFIKRLFE